jgi:DNA-binding transcriptional ArsR family regulator
MKPEEAMLQQCQEAAQLLKAMAHPERLRILCHLSEKEMTVSALEAGCQASQSQVSHFLARMKAEGLLTSRREGSFVYYQIKDARLVKLLRAMHRIFCPA